MTGGYKINKDLELNRGYTLIIEGKYEEALRVYDEILKEDPKNTEALLKKGVCYYYLARRT